ncbi:ASB3, partial [Cordylochernes scorpioides]
MILHFIAQSRKKLSVASSFEGEAAGVKNPPLSTAAKLQQNFVLPNSNPSIILGWDFLEASNAVIDCGRTEIRLEEAKDVLNSPASMGKVVASRSVIIPAESTKLINVMSEELNGQNQVLFEPSKKVLIRKGLTLPCALFRLSHNKGKLWIVNSSTTAQIVPMGLFLGKIQRVEENNLTAISECSEFNKEVKNVNHASHADKSDFKFLQNLISDDLSEEQQSQILSILKRYDKIFDKNNEPVKQTSVTKHKIETRNHQPIKHRPYRVSPTERQAIQTEVDKMLDAGIIRHSESPWSSPVILVKKKDGDWRFCVDYRRLNKVTKKYVYILPRIDDTLDSLKGAKFYSSKDLRSGYWQIEVDKADREKTAFITPDGLYEFLVMPFGLCNAPATFERMMDKILKGLKWTMALCLDDIVVYSKLFNEHLHRLEIILQCLDKAELHLNPKNYIENKIQEGFEIVLYGDLNDRTSDLGDFRNLLDTQTLLSASRASSNPVSSSLSETLVDFFDDNSLTILNGLLKGINEIKPVEQEFHQLFNGDGCLKNFEYRAEFTKGDHKLEIKPPRRIPLKIKDEVKKQLDLMEKSKVIKRMEEPTPVSSHMVVVKQGGKYRICIDPSDLNKILLRRHYPLRTIEDIASNIKNSKYFTKLDFIKGFWQLKVAAETQSYMTFSTPWGRYAFLRVPFGIKTAPEIFQNTISKIVENIPGVENSMDDILIHAEDIQTLRERTKIVMTTLQEPGARLNKDKCEFEKTKIKFLGHIFTSDGIKTDEEKVKAIDNIKSPSNKKELQTLLGMVQYLNKFIPNLSEITYRMRLLLKKNTEWQWDSLRDKDMERIKDLLKQAPTLKYYDPNKDV